MVLNPEALGWGGARVDTILFTALPAALFIIYWLLQFVMWGLPVYM